jgi:Organic solvent tolerance protein OstA
LKRFLLYILLLIVTGCKVLQQPVNDAGQQSDASLQTKSEEVSHAGADNSLTDIQTENIVATEELPHDSVTDSISGNILHPDSLALYPDSMNIGLLPADSLTTDTIPRKKGALEATVDYEARDSIVLTAGNIAYLFSESDVKYQNIELKSDVIKIVMDSSLIYAYHGTDSLGEEFGLPVFTQGEQTIEAKELSYSFKTQEGFIKQATTQQGEGYVTSLVAKKMPDGVINMENGRYTTCDEPYGHQHFYFKLTKAKTRPGKNVVSGPVYLVVEDVPLFPLVLPFAFFPFTDTYSSGIIMPSYGDEMNKGFYLHNGGYYFALSDFFDFALTGELYTKGSWGLTGALNYRKRYKYSGNFDLSYNTTKLGDKGLDDYSVSKDFKVRWSHSQDAKSNPYRTISASVDYSTSSYNRNNLSTMFTQAATQNNKGSSVSYSQRFPGKPISLTATMNINQRTQDSTISLTFPDMNISMSRIYPLKRKNAIGKERWYEKISIDYNGQLRNSITTKDNKLFESNIIKDWKNAIQHRSNVSATYSILEHVNLTPSFNYTERWYTNKVDQAYDPDLRRMAPSDTTYGFYRVYNYSGAVSASTTLYGTFKPVKFLQKLTKLTTIRHRMEPSISFSATPDFGDHKYGYYKDYTYRGGMNIITGRADTILNTYSPFNSGHLFGVPGAGKSGTINFTLSNNIEAKILDEEEKSGERKISLIDNLSGSMSYNLVKDSMKWSDLSTSIRLKLTKSYTLNLNAVFDTYTYEYDKNSNRLYYVDKPRWTVGKGIGRLRQTGSSFSYTFNNETFKRSSKEKRNKDRDLMDEDEYDPDDPYGELEDIAEQTNRNERSSRDKKKQGEGEYDYDGYYNNTVQWSFTFNYSLSLGYDPQKIDIEKKEYKYKLNHSLSFNGSLKPTKNWNLSFNATYDVEHGKLSYVTCNISRQMHCFQMSASIIPVGMYKTYSFTIQANSSMLKDLKYDTHSSQYGSGNLWY